MNSSSKTPAQLMEQLAALPADQLRQVQARAGFLLSGQQADPSGAKSLAQRDATADEQLVYAELAGVLHKFVGQAPPYGQFRSRHAKYPAFREAVAALLEFVGEHLRPKTRAERVKAVRVLVGVVVRHRAVLHRASVSDPRRRRRARGVSIFTAVDDLCRVGDIVDEAFPGYLEAGLLPILLRATVQRQRVA
jgi:hypothetical protein